MGCHMQLPHKNRAFPGSRTNPPHVHSVTLVCLELRASRSTCTPLTSPSLVHTNGTSHRALAQSPWMTSHSRCGPQCRVVRSTDMHDACRTPHTHATHGHRTRTTPRPSERCTCLARAGISQHCPRPHPPRPTHLHSHPRARTLSPDAHPPPHDDSMSSLPLGGPSFSQLRRPSPPTLSPAALVDTS